MATAVGVELAAEAVAGNTVPGSKPAVAADELAVVDVEAVAGVAVEAALAAGMTAASVAQAAVPDHTAVAEAANETSPGSAGPARRLQG